MPDVSSVRERQAAASRRYRQRNPRARRNTLLKSRYGLGIEEYEEMLRAQDGRCAICGDEQKLHVDHDHTTNEVRGLLCGNCNRMLGLAKDSEDTLLNAIVYLRGGV